MMRLHGWDMCGTWPLDKKVITFAGPIRVIMTLAIYAMMALNVQFRFSSKKTCLLGRFVYGWAAYLLIVPGTWIG